VESKLESTVHYLSAEELAFVSLVYSKLIDESRALFQVLKRLCTDNIEAFSSVNLSLLLSAFARAQVKSAMFKDRAAKVTMYNIEQRNLTPRQLVINIWAFTVLKSCDRQLYQSFEKEACDRIHEFEAWEIPSMVGSFLRSAHEADEFFRIVRPVILERVNEFSIHELGILARYWLLAVGYFSIFLFSVFCFPFSVFYFLLSIDY
jgi:hypothetical protein